MIFSGITPGTAALLFLGAAAVLTGLHFLRNRYREQRVPGTMLWREVAVRPSRRILSGRLSNLWSLLLMLLMAALLFAALCEPVTPPPAEIPRTVIVCDAFSAAEAKNFARQLNPAVTAVITAGAIPRRVKDFGERLMPVQPEPHEAPNLAEAVRMAEAMLRDFPNRQIAVFSRQLPPYNADGLTYHGPAAAAGAPAAETAVPLKIHLAAGAPAPLRLLAGSVSSLELTEAAGADVVIRDFPDFTPAQWADPNVVMPYLRSLLEHRPDRAAGIRQATVEKLPPPSGESGGTAWFNLLLGAALLFFLIDFALYRQQRIP